MSILGGYRVVLQFAKSAVDALALERLSQIILAQADALSGPLVEGGELRLRFTRPALTFPEDAPDMVRLGWAIEGGAQLPAGHILSIDAFITATAAPYMARNEAGWFAAVGFTGLDLGEIEITYAGEPIVDAVDNAMTVLSPEAINALRATVRERVMAAMRAAPPLSLTYTLRALGLDNADLHIQPETKHGGALTLGLRRGEDLIAEQAKIAIGVTMLQNIAVMLGSTGFAEALQAQTDPFPLLPLPGWRVTNLAGRLSARHCCLELTVAPEELASVFSSEPSAKATVDEEAIHATDVATDDTAVDILPESVSDTAPRLTRVGLVPVGALMATADALAPLPIWESVTIQIEGRPLISDGSWDLLVDSVVLPDDLAEEHPVRGLVEAPRADTELRLALAARVRRAVMAALAQALGEDSPDGIGWHLPRPYAPDQDPWVFVPTLVYVARGTLVASSALPIETSVAEPEDAPAFLLRLLRDPLPGEAEELLATITADHFQRMPEPHDIRWGISLAGVEAPASHEPTVRFSLRPPPPDRESDDAMQAHTRARALPPGFVLISATGIDAYGRVARADLELDLAPFHGWVEAAPGAPAGGVGRAESTTAFIAQMRLTVGAVARRLSPRGVRYGMTSAIQGLGHLTRRLPIRSHAWTLLAGTLSLVAILISIITVVLTRPNVGLGGAKTPTPTITLPTVTPTMAGGIGNVVTATPSLAPARTFTPTGPATATPILFGRFAITPLSPSFSCHTTTVLPISLTLTDSGTASLNWDATAVEQISGELWATIVPQVGTLAPGKTANIQIFPVAGFCSATGKTFQIQFTAPNAVPVIISVTRA